MPYIDPTQAITRITKGIADLNLQQLLVIFHDFKTNGWLPKDSHNYTRDSSEIKYEELYEVVRVLYTVYVTKS